MMSNRKYVNTLFIKKLADLMERNRDSHSGKDISIDLIKAALKLVRSTNSCGASISFSPGWIVIFTLLKYLNQHPIFAEVILYLPFIVPSNSIREHQKLFIEKSKESMMSISMESHQVNCYSSKCQQIIHLPRFSKLFLLEFEKVMQNIQNEISCNVKNDSPQSETRKCIARCLCKEGAINAIVLLNDTGVTFFTIQNTFRENEHHSAYISTTFKSNVIVSNFHVIHTFLRNCKRRQQRYYQINETQMKKDAPSSSVSVSLTCIFKNEDGNINFQFLHFPWNTKFSSTGSIFLTAETLKSFFNSIFTIEIPDNHNRPNNISIRFAGTNFDFFPSQFIFLKFQINEEKTMKELNIFVSANRTIPQKSVFVDKRCERNCSKSVRSKIFRSLLFRTKKVCRSIAKNDDETQN